MVSLSVTVQLSHTPIPRHPLLFTPYPFTTAFKPFSRRTLPPQPPTASRPAIAFSALDNHPQQQPPRTLFPGGYKRPEIKVPDLVLQLTTDDVLNDDVNALDVVDKAVSKWVGIVVLTDAGASGGAGKLYEAARLLKSVIKDRAYLLIDERVDIAAAVNASGVLLSDQGLPAIVARNTMSGSQSNSVVLPLVARNVQTSSAALDASDVEGADFLIYRINKNGQPEELMSSVLKSVKIPIFVIFDFLENEKWIDEASDLLKSGASGLVLSLEELKFSSGDKLSKLLQNADTWNATYEESVQTFGKLQMFDGTNGSVGKSGMSGFLNLDERESQFIETERSVMLEAIGVIRRAAPLMEDVSLLIDAVSQLDDPFLLVIVGEFNSGKSTVINALLGKRYVKDGVVPTTNEITFLRYSEADPIEQQRCERHPDGQYVCYLPAPILKEMIIVDTPGTNVILQRQQRLTEEFVPRADLILFVISADRPLTESEVNFLRYIQQWKKKVVFVLNKADLYQNADELEEALTFIKDNVKKMLNAQHVLLYPVSARSALEEKLSASRGAYGELDRQAKYSQWGTTRFSELEKYLYSFLDGSTNNGIERVKLKLETPVRIAEQLLSSCQKIVREESQLAKEDLASLDELINSVKEYSRKMEIESISWKKQILSLIDDTQSRIVKIAESTLKLSNLDLVTKYIFKGEKPTTMPVTASIQNGIIGPSLSNGEKLLREYVAWLDSNNVRQGRFYKECLEKRWPSFLAPPKEAQLDPSEFQERTHETSIKAIQEFSAAAASKLFDQEIREVFLGTFGGLGAAGLSASLLTSVLPTTLEDLLALGFCSAGGLLAISNFPARRQRAIDKVKRTADALAREIDNAMQKDLLETTASLENFVQLIGKPYQDASQHRLDKALRTLDELSDIEEKLRALQIEIQNLHVLR